MFSTQGIWVGVSSVKNVYKFSFLMRHRVQHVYFSLIAIFNLRNW